MSNFAYMPDTSNLLLRPGVSILTSYNGTSYRYTNLTALPISKPWRSDYAGSEWILIDFGYPVDITLMAVINHNLSADATIGVTYGSTAACSSTLASGITNRTRDAFRLSTGAALTNTRFVKLTFADTGNEYGFIQVGYLMMGAVTVATTNYSYGWQRTDEYFNATSVSEYGTTRIAELYSRKRYRLPFDNLLTAQATTLQTLLATTARDAELCFFVPDAAVNDGYCGRFTSDITVSAPRVSTYRDTDIEFAEDPRGYTITEGHPFIYHSNEALSGYEATYDRASAAYYMGNGLSDEYLSLTSAAEDTARIDHQPTLGTKVLLLEPARENPWTYSEELEEAAWTLNEATVDDDATTAPDGTTTADKLIESDVNTYHQVSRQISGCTNDTVTAFSVYAKAAERTWLAILAFRKDGTQATYPYVNLSTGAKGAGGNGGLTRLNIVTVGNGWYRIEGAFDVLAGGSTPAVGFIIATGDTVYSYDGDAASGIYLWGMQVEVDKPQPSSYVKTVAAAVTRAVDTLYFTFDDEYPQQLTAYVRFVELGSSLLANGTTVLHIGKADGTGCCLRIDKAAGGYQVRHHNGTAEVTSALAAFPTIGDMVELRATLKHDGKVQIHQSINGAAETDSVESAANALAGSWGDTRLYLNSYGTSGVGTIGICAAKVLYGIQTQAYCRTAE